MPLQFLQRNVMSIQVAQNSPNTQNNTQGNLQGAARSHAYDGVDKLRVSLPQSLIDTDFEYGLQPTKWESISLQNNRPSIYFDPQVPIAINFSGGITSDGASPRSMMTLNLASGTPPAVGQPIFIQNSLNVNVDGVWYVESSGGLQCTFRAGGVVTAGANYANPANTYAYAGNFFSRCGFNIGTNSMTAVGTTVTVTTLAPHGLSRGNQIFITGAGGSNPPNGAWVVDSAPTASTFTFTSINNASGITNTAGNTTVFSRPAGFLVNRPTDGGVSFTSGAAIPNAQLIRQTRRYFRYQSGKAIQFSTGSSVQPTLPTQSITSFGQTITVTTQGAHNMAVGTVVQIAQCNQIEYNGNFTILTTPTLNTFTYQSITPPSVSPATTATQFRVGPISWYGSVNRMGIFDQQNGAFFEYDGQELFAVRRNSTLQLTGTVQVTLGSGTVTGLNTAFSTQLTVRDYIVIRGQSYRVINIQSDTILHISPEYRGESYSGSTTGGFTVSRTRDLRIPRSQWQDPLNGTGPSGFNMDLTRMQMWFVDYSWYGAGVIRWGVRAAGGAIIYCHSLQSSNIEYEAYMRSGNLPAHYEVDGISPATQITATYSSAEVAGSSLFVTSTAGFPPTGAIRVQNAGVNGTAEIMNYSLKTATSFVISARAQTGATLAAQNFIYTSTALVGVEYVSPDTTTVLNHWGSSVIMDGRFDDDKSLIFNFGSTSTISIPAGATVPIIALRIAPAVDSGTTGLFGAKEIVNHMQLQPYELGVVTSGPFLIQLTLNAFVTNFSGQFVRPVVGSQISSSLAQVALNTTTTATITGGESAIAAFTNTNGQTTLDLRDVRDLGNSILGGGFSNTLATTRQGFYPDGPDVVYVSATNTGAAAATILARLSWKEAQA